jgi:hypothetical protein
LGVPVRSRRAARQVQARRGDGERGAAARARHLRGLRRGRRLFSNGIDETALRLVDAKLVSDCLILIYVPTGG